MKKNNPIFLILSAVVIFAVMISASFCSPWLIPPDDDPYDDDDPSVTGHDQYEPDNIPAEATPIIVGNGGAQNHTIYNANGVYDVDYVKFSATIGRTYRINMFNIKGFEPEMTLYAPNGTTIIEMKNTGMYTDEYDWWGYDVDHNFSADEKESIVFEPEETSVYYISVKDIYGAHGKGSYSIKVLEIVDVGETNSLVAVPDPVDFQINVSWGAISGVDGYYLYRTNITQNITDPNYSDFSIITTLSGTNYVDTSIQPNTTYYYYVKGYIGVNVGNPSNVDDAMFDWATFKPKASIINASEGQTNQITITLQSKYNNANITEYKVYKASSPSETNPTLLNSFAGTDPIGSTIIDTNVVPGTYYYYCVRIVININSTPTESALGWYDSGVADN